MTEPKESKLNRGTLLAVVFRAIFLQACWNFQRMQNLGFAFAIKPILGKLAKNRKQYIQSLKRHLDFFNTHPYCVSLILGVVCRTEEELSRSKEVNSDRANRLKVGMMGPLAALGDIVFWARLKPATALVGVGLILISPWGEVWPAALGPLLFVTLFSLPQLGLRIGGVFLGYRRGLEIVKDLRRYNPQLIAQRLSLFIAVSVGALAGICTFIYAPQLSSLPFLGMAALPVTLALVFWGLRRGIAPTYLYYGMVGLGIILAFVGLV